MLLYFLFASESSAALMSSLPAVEQKMTNPVSLDLKGHLTSVAPSQGMNRLKALFSMPQLTMLDLSDNHITDEEAEYIADELEHNTTLTVLKLNHNDIEDKGVAFLAKMLEKNTKLAVLNLHHNSGFSHAGATALAYMLEKNTTLKTLILGENFIEDAGGIILQALQKNKGLTELDLSRNEIYGDGITNLIEALGVNKTLVSLNFSHNHIEGRAIPLAKALETNKTLKRLNIYGNFNIDGTKALLNMLKVNTTLTEFSFSPRLEKKFEFEDGLDSQEDLEESGIVVLRAMLEVNKTLKVLGLRSASIGREGGMKILVKALQKNNTLTELDLSDNQLGEEEGVMDLAEMLTTNHSLEVLNIRDNQIEPEKVIALSTALESNTTLKTLDLGDNEIASEGSTALAGMLMVNSSLHTLKLGEAEIKDDEAILFANMLRENKKLKELDLSRNGITHKGFMTFVEALRENQHLEVIDFENNNIKLSAEEIGALLEMLKINRSLKEIRLFKYGYSSHEMALFAQIDQLLENNKLIAESNFERNINIIMNADRSSAAKLLNAIWGNIAEYLGYPESFIKEYLIYELDEMKRNHKSFQELKQRLYQKALSLGIRSSKMGRGNTEEDLRTISNEPSEVQQRLRALYDKEPVSVKKEFGFHRWLKMQSSFYDSDTRNQNPKPSFEEWLQAKKK